MGAVRSAGLRCTRARKAVLPPPSTSHAARHYVLIYPAQLLLGVCDQHRLGIADLRDRQGHAGELEVIIALLLEPGLLDVLRVLKVQAEQLILENLEGVQDYVSAALLPLVQGP